MEHRAESDFVRATVGLDLTAEEQAAITHRNAERLFGL